MDAKEQKLKETEMQATLAANLAVLKEQKPDIYERFKNFQATDTKLKFDTAGHLNLFNNKQFVYPDDPKELAQKQVVTFFKNPSIFSFEINHRSDEDVRFQHEELLKSIQNVRIAEAQSNIKHPISEQRLDFVCFLGGGLGYQIEALLNVKSVLNVFLFEPSEGSFFALLHTIKLQPLFDKCRSKGGEFSIQIAGNEHGIINNISELLINQGHFNLSQMLFFKHYNSPLIERVINTIQSLAYRWSNSWGFFEDEITGVSHTLSNLKANFPVLKKTSLFTNPIKDAPVFVVANGPSLDSAIDFLKKNQDNIIIVSCGTTLKALLVNDIIPDVHVEMERPAFLIDWIKVVERTEGINTKLDQLNIVALNTVYDEILKLFKSAYLIPKINDTGGQLIQSFDKKEIFNYPPYTNPTVTNAGLAIAIELGFKKVNLVGTDFGFISQDHHHSKHSIFFDDNFKEKERISKIMQTDKVVKGNFRDEVFATNIFDASRGNIELLLQANPQITAFNTADGAHIEFAKAKRIDDITIKNKITNKQEVMNALLKDATSSEQISVEDLNGRMTTLKDKVKSALEQLLSIASTNYNSREELANTFAVQNKMLLCLRDGNSDDKFVYILIQGTFKYFQTYIMTNCYYYHDLEKRNNFINACVAAFQAHLSDLYLEFINNYDKPSKV